MIDNSSIATDQWGLFRVIGITVGVVMLLALEIEWLSFEQYVSVMLFMIFVEVECLV